MEDFGELRSYLHEPPSARAWSRITQWLTRAWERDGGQGSGQELPWLTYTSANLDRYPDELRFASERWFDPPIWPLLALARDPRSRFLCEAIQPLGAIAPCDWNTRHDVEISPALPRPRELDRVAVSDAQILSLSVAMNTPMLAVGDYANRWTVLDEASLEPIASGYIPGEDGATLRLREIALSQDGSKLATVVQVSGGNYHRRELVIVDVASATIIKRDEWGYYQGLAWSAFGNYLTTQTYNETVVWDERGEPIWSREIEDGPITAASVGVDCVWGMERNRLIEAPIGCDEARVRDRLHAWKPEPGLAWERRGFRRSREHGLVSVALTARSPQIRLLGTESLDERVSFVLARDWPQIVYIHAAWARTSRRLGLTLVHIRADRATHVMYCEDAGAPVWAYDIDWQVWGEQTRMVFSDRFERAYVTQDRSLIVLEA